MNQIGQGKNFVTILVVELRHRYMGCLMETYLLEEQNRFGECVGIRIQANEEKLLER